VKIGRWRTRRPRRSYVRGVLSHACFHALLFERFFCRVARKIL
jgi:hypothetical protein